MMLMNNSKEYCGFISLARSSTNYTLSCSAAQWQLQIFSHITENGTIYPFLAIPEQPLSAGSSQPPPGTCSLWSFLDAF